MNLNSNAQRNHQIHPKLVDKHENKLWVYKKQE